MSRYLFSSTISQKERLDIIIELIARIESFECVCTKQELNGMDMVPMPLILTNFNRN